MSGVLDTTWFYWAIAVAIGFPLVLILLTELHNGLLRRDSVLARPVHLLRNYILPLGALLILLVQAVEIPGEATPVRVAATAFSFFVLVLVLSTMNATLFHSAPEDTWRRRIPSIFLDVARFALIAVGVTLIFAFIWGANVAGLFAALGVTSIVLGLALQNAVGQIVSGLLVLFEQPFRLGDWVDTPSASGQVVEVNWRATHIDTGGGLRVIPNSELAESSFTNLSRPPGEHVIIVPTIFSLGDSPDEVCDMLTRVAGNLPQCHPEATPSARSGERGEYQTLIPLRTPADAFTAKATFLRWVWYAARRAGLHLDRALDQFATPERLAGALRTIAPALRLSDTEQQELLPRVTMTRYGRGEPIQYVGEVPDRMTFVVQGRIRLTVRTADGAEVEVRLAGRGDFLGQSTLTREPVYTGAYAVDEVTVVQLERPLLEELVAQKPLLLQDIGRAIEERRTGVKRVLSSAD